MGDTVMHFLCVIATTPFNRAHRVVSNTAVFDQDSFAAD